MRKGILILFFLILTSSAVCHAKDYDIWSGIKENKYESMTNKIKTLTSEELEVILGDKEKVNSIPNFLPKLLIRISAYNTNPNVIKRMLKEKTPINDESTGDSSLLFAASNNENPEIIKLLLDAGANINQKNKYGGTALYEASRFNNNLEVIKELIKLGANINEKDSDGETALIGALQRNPNLDIARYLIEAGADVKAKDNNGNTALIYLFDREPKVDAPDIVQKLIDGGVDVNDYDLKNPLEYAHVCKLKKSEKILIKAGAKMKKENSSERLERIDFNCKKYSTYSWADIQINLH